MSSFLPQIASLQETPSINYRYADILLNLLVTKLLSMDEFDIGIFETKDEKGSVIGFNGDEFENEHLELQYSDNRFILILHENSEENFACIFSYKIFQDSDFYQRIPENIRNAMGDVADNFKPAVYRPTT